MTLCEDRPVATGEGARRRVGSTLRVAADGSYAARLVAADGRGRQWLTERWTLDGPEPYAVRLPAERPEEPDSEVLPLPDGRVLIRRPVDGGHRFDLLYPTGPGTGELPLGRVPEPTAGASHADGPASTAHRVSLLPPPPDASSRAYALVGDEVSVVWQVCGGGRRPEPVAEVPGRCAGGVWLDRAGWLLALDRTDGQGRTKTIVVDLARGGRVTPLLCLSETSQDRLLLADPDSGLLLVRSDAAGEDRLGWGVLDSHRPLRFPNSLHPPGLRLTPFAVQPGQALQPENCAVALRVDGPHGTWVAVWRAAGRSAASPDGTVRRELRHLPAPEGWLPGTGLWTPHGELRLPCSTRRLPCGLARLAPPAPEPPLPPRRRVRIAAALEGASAALAGQLATPRRPVPLQHAPLAGVR